MKELKRKIDELVVEELARANKNFPQFHSRHEALGVLDEEVYEMQQELFFVTENLNSIKIGVFEDREIDEAVADAYEDMQAMLAEGIQVMAMLAKFNCLLEREKQ